MRVGDKGGIVESESFEEQISRLKLMADPNESCYKWDLSDNDRAAIRALLDAYEKLNSEPCVDCVAATTPVWPHGVCDKHSSLSIHQ